MFYGGASVILLILAEYQINGNYVNHAYFGNVFDRAPLYDAFYLTYLIVSSAFGCTWIFLFELYLKRTHYLLTVFTVVISGISFSFPLSIADPLITVFLGALLYIIIILYYSLMLRNSSSSVKASMPMILTGFIFGMISLTLHDIDFKALEILPIELAPIALIAGSFFFIIPMILDPKYLNKEAVFKITLLIFGIFLSLLAGFFLWFVSLSSIAILFITSSIITLSIYWFSRSMKLSKKQRIAPAQEVSRDLSNLYSRPEKLTEEEIAISKEKKVCLVCKGGISGYNFICGKCGTFFCEKCAKALTELENACWSCKAPFDPSRPVRLEKPEEEHVGVVPEATVAGTKDGAVKGKK